MPTNFTGTLNGNDLTLTWTASQNANQYVIYQYIGKEWVEIATTTATKFTVTGLPLNKGTSFRVAAKNTTTGVMSAQTATQTFTPSQLAPPATPTNFAITLDANKATLTWSASLNANQYVIYQYISKEWVEIATTTATKYTVTGLAYDKSASFRVAALHTSSGFMSAQTATQTVTPERPLITGPTVPSNFAGTLNGNTLTLTWTASLNTNLYVIYQYIGKEWVEVATTTTTTYTATGLALNKGTSFRVAAKNTSTGAISAQTATLTFTPTQLAPPLQARALLGFLEEEWLVASG